MSTLAPRLIAPAGMESFGKRSCNGTVPDSIEGSAATAETMAAAGDRLGDELIVSLRG